MTVMSETDALIDPEAVVAWLLREGILDDDQTATAERLGGGYSNVMFRLRLGEHRWVLRRPAKVAVERANDGMRREFRILTALEGTNAPHPKPVALCEDEEVLGCVFYVMEEVEGVVPHGPGLGVFTENDADRAELAFALVDALAELHKVDWRAAGLSDFGKPDGFHERQVSRWSGQLASYGGREIPGMAEAGRWLEAHIPEVWSPTIMHADYHMFNVLIHPEPPARVVAIVDWETASIGDPFLDFIGFCEAWKSMRAEGGWPSYQEMMEQYLLGRNLLVSSSGDSAESLRSDASEGHESAGEQDLADRKAVDRQTADSTDSASQSTPVSEPSPTDQQYYAVLYNYRLAVLLEGIYQRSLQDPTREDQHGIGERALFNADRCSALIADPDLLFD